MKTIQTICNRSGTPNFRSKKLAGGALIEFALIITLLITILAGIVEFGRTFWYYNALTKVTRDAARLLSVAPKATIASNGVQSARDLVVASALNAGVPGFSSANVTAVCTDATFIDTPCVDGTAPEGVHVAITGYTVSIGQYIPFLLGTTRQYSAGLAPHTTMRYML